MRSVEPSLSPSEEDTRLSLSRAAGGATDGDSTGVAGGGEDANCFGGQAGGGCAGDATPTTPLGGREGDAKNGGGGKGGGESGGGKSGDGGGGGGGVGVGDGVGGNDGKGGGGATVLHATVPAGQAPPFAAKHARMVPAT